MHYPNQQVGWSQEAILMQKIIKQLQYINKALSSATGGGSNSSAPTATGSPTTTPTTTT